MLLEVTVVVDVVVDGGDVDNLTPDKKTEIETAAKAEINSGLEDWQIKPLDKDQPK